MSETSAPVGATPMTAETNQEVGDEGHVTARGGDALSFRDLEQFVPEKAAKKDSAKPEKADKKEPKPEKPEKESAEDEGVDPLEDESGEEKAAKADKKPDAKQEAKSSAKSKSFKFSHGDSQIDLHSDAAVEIPFNGGKAQVSLQELVNSYNGHQVYTKKIQEADDTKKRYEKSFTELNERVSKLYEATQKEPEAGWDYLAEVSGKDPVEFKVAMLRSQIAEAKKLAELDDDQIEKLILAKENEWHKRTRASQAQQVQETQAQQKARAQEVEAREAFGLDDDSWMEGYELAKRHLHSQGSKDEPTPQQVVYAQRWSALSTRLESELPHLVNRDDFGDILNDATMDMLKKPGLTIDKAIGIIGEVFGTKPKASASQQNLARRVDSNARISGEGSIRDRSVSKQVSGEPTFFSDL